MKTVLLLSLVLAVTASEDGHWKRRILRGQSLNGDHIPNADGVNHADAHTDNYNDYIKE